MESQDGQVAELVFVLNGIPPDVVFAEQMLFNDFEMFLSGNRPMLSWAGMTKYYVYVQFDRSLNITACVLFTVDIDEQGQAPDNWNLPFHQLCMSAGKGPDLGAGPIRLTCASQCSVPWHQAKLWDYDEFPGVFIEAQTLLAECDLPIEFSESSGVEEEDDDELQLNPEFKNENYQQDSPFQPSYSQPAPFQNQQVPLSANPSHLASAFVVSEPASTVQTEPRPSASEIGSGSDISQVIGQKLQLKVQELELEFHNQASVLEQDHLKQQTQMQKKYEHRINQMADDHDKSLMMLNEELTEIKAKMAHITQQKMTLEELNHTQKNQIDRLHEQVEQVREQSQLNEKKERQTAAEKYETLYNKRLSEQTAKWESSLDEKTTELKKQEDTIKQLRKDITDLRRDKIRLLNSGADKFFEKMEGLGINFIAFHPGAGHVSIPLSDMSRYIENPIAYAAEKCSVDEAHYRRWLSHYETPICRFQISKDEICSCKIKRVDIPKNFVEGKGDRCEKHQSAFAGLENVNVNASATQDMTASK